MPIEENPGDLIRFELHLRSHHLLALLARIGSFIGLFIG
jgi:hypothetical protein